jgi:hypothetical protein
MSKEHTYVVCRSCGHWSDHLRRKEICRACNNTRQVIDPREILCNLCGECMCPVDTMNEQVPHGLYQAEVTGGYNSYHLFDMSKYVFSFCEKCLRQLFIQCKIKPEIFDINRGREEGWELDQKYYEYMIWKDNGEHHQAYLNSRCNTEKDCPNSAVYTRLHNDEFSENCACEDHKDEHAYSNSKLTKFISPVLRVFL